MHASITSDRILEACEADDHIGLCVVCGAENHGVEPDARRYACDSCGKKGVFGAPELLVSAPSVMVA